MQTSTPTPTPTTTSTPEIIKTLQQMITNAKELNTSKLNLTQEQLNQLILYHFEQQYQQVKSSSGLLLVPLNSSSTIPNLLPPLPRSKYSTNMDSLKEITARKLELKRNEGFYLKVKVIKKPWKLPGPASSINVVLKDKDQDILRASFYNTEEPEESFYMDREIVILHPFYKIAADGIVYVRVENRFEFFFSDEETPGKKTSFDFAKLFQEIKALKDHANKFFATNKNKALEKYHKSLEVFLKQRPNYALDQKDFFLEWKVHLEDHEKKQVLDHLSAVFSNCSLVYIEKDQPLIGLYYANFSSWCNPDFVKARLRKAKALIDILHPHDALDLLEFLNTVDIENKFESEIKQLTEEAHQVINKYSSSQIIAGFLNNKLFLKHWNEQKSYIGPIMLQTTQHKGRGFFARRNISRGEILLLECGFLGGTDISEMTYNLLTKLEQREDLKPLYTNLFPSHISEIPKYEKEDMNENLKDALIKLNFDTYRLQHPHNWKNFNEDEVSLMAIKTSLNMFGVGDKEALYPNLCLLNHSCAPNTSQWYQDNKLLLLASEDIPKGSEIFNSYTAIMNDTETRKESLESYGFDCDCVRCQGKNGWNEKEAGLTAIKCPNCHTDVLIKNGKYQCPKDSWEITKREGDAMWVKIYDKLGQIHDSIPTKKGVEIQDLEIFLEEIDKSYPKYSVIRANVLYVICRYYALKSDEKMFFKYYDEIMKIIQFFPYHELRLILNSLLRDYFMGLGKELPVERLKDLEYFGLPLEASLQLWKDFKESDGKNWFLPMTTLL